ncbi:C6 transcription factor [Aspergillus sclerotialis]|uniref:C6 transcription factor n=1 Tax=Aspergillus sclerotialis TaxID=2070753 RepID=A0A3A2Z7N5_9EURO|nr:C6 transcription factor [Aspergillus sclerotialis]
MEIRRPSRGGYDRTYQRAYKACISCRQRKSKCDLGTGPDGLPIGPPCTRCRREQRECVFSEKRAWERTRKRPTSDDNETSPSTRPRLSSQARDEPYDGVEHNTSPTTYSALGDNTNNSPAQDDRRSRHQSTSTLANSMMRTVVSSGNDALNILFEAAAAAHNQDNGQDEQGEREQGPSSGRETGRHSVNGKNSTVDPDVLQKAVQPVELSDASKEILNVWEACRFVKMGWFTSREAVTFID